MIAVPVPAPPCVRGGKRRDRENVSEKNWEGEWEAGCVSRPRIACLRAPRSTPRPQSGARLRPADVGVGRGRGDRRMSGHRGDHGERDAGRDSGGSVAVAEASGARLRSGDAGSAQDGPQRPVTSLGARPVAPAVYGELEGVRKAPRERSGPPVVSTAPQRLDADFVCLEVDVGSADGEGLGYRAVGGLALD